MYIYYLYSFMVVIETVFKKYQNNENSKIYGKVSLEKSLNIHLSQQYDA